MSIILWLHRDIYTEISVLDFVVAMGIPVSQQKIVSALFVFTCHEN